MALLITPDGVTKEVYPGKPEELFTLEELHGFVDGYIEVLYLTDHRVMIINEEGKLNSLPYNDKATFLYRLTHETDDYIVGNALVAHYPKEVD